MQITVERAQQVIDATRVVSKGKVPQFFRCGCCECFHSRDFYGDCRNDAERFAMDELDEALGAFNWEEIEQPE